MRRHAVRSCAPAGPLRHPGLSGTIALLAAETASGNLEVAIPGRGRDTLRSLIAVKTMAETVRAVVTEVKTAANNGAAVAGKLSGPGLPTGLHAAGFRGRTRTDHDATADPSSCFTSASSSDENTR